MEFTTSLKRNYEFRRLYQKGKSAAALSLVVYYRPNCTKDNRLGITVSNKIGKAVVRNLVRRRIKEIYRLNEGRFKRGMDMVIVARVKSACADYARLEKDLFKTCALLGILKEEGEA